MSQKSKLESILFISPKPMSIKKMAELVGGEADKVKEVLKELMEKHNVENSGINILEIGQKFQMVAAPSSKKLVQEFIKEEMTGDLTRPQLEALTVVAYRGPISKLELEQIRGVSCSLILRNLMIRGLVEMQEKRKEKYYNITFDFMRHLGINKPEELPDYEKLHSSEVLERLLDGGSGAVVSESKEEKSGE